jgi:hypothetical protein
MYKGDEAIVSRHGYIKEQTLYDFEVSVLHHLDIRHPVPPRFISKRARKIDMEDDAAVAHALGEEDSQGDSGAQSTVHLMSDYLRRLQLAHEDRADILVLLDSKGRSLTENKQLEWMMKDVHISKTVNTTRRNLSAAQLAAAAEVGVVSEEVAVDKQIEENAAKEAAARKEAGLEEVAVDPRSAAARPKLHGPKVKLMDVLYTKRLIHSLEDLLSGRNLSCAQLAFLMNRLPQYDRPTGRLGTVRVDFIVVMASQIVDMYNFDLVIQRLDSPREAAMLQVRLGWLNVWSPLKPEGYYVLDLGDVEQRVVAKALLLLSVLEKGDVPSTRLPRLRDMTYLADKAKNVATAEVLTESRVHQTWLTEKGLPTEGVWRVLYHSVLSIKDDERDDDIVLDPRPRLHLMALVTARAHHITGYFKYTMRGLERHARKHLGPVVLAASLAEEGGEGGVEGDTTSSPPSEDDKGVEASDSDYYSSSDDEHQKEEGKSNEAAAAELAAESVLAMRRPRLLLEQPDGDGDDMADAVSSESPIEAPPSPKKKDNEERKKAK